MKAFHLWQNVDGMSLTPLTFGTQRKKAASLLHVMGGTNHFLIGFKVHSVGENTYVIQYIWSKAYSCRPYLGLERNPTTVVCHIDVLSNTLLNIYFYTHTLLLLSPWLEKLLFEVDNNQ